MSPRQPYGWRRLRGHAGCRRIATAQFHWNFYWIRLGTKRLYTDPTGHEETAGFTRPLPARQGGLVKEARGC